jgi:hypothetical protein
LSRGGASKKVLTSNSEFFLVFKGGCNFRSIYSFVHELHKNPPSAVVGLCENKKNLSQSREGAKASAAEGSLDFF